MWADLRFLLFGAMSLMVYNVFLHCLPFFIACFGGQFSNYAHVVYAVASNCVQLFSIFIGSHLPFDHRILTACLGLATVSILFPVFAVSSNMNKQFLGLILSGGLGMFCAIIQSTGSGLAGLSSPTAVVYFYLGQSISCLLPWPVIEGLNGVYRRFGLSSISLDRPSPSDTATTLTVMVSAAIISILFIVYYFQAFTEKLKPPTSTWASIKRVLGDMWPWALCTLSLFGVTFSVYPSLLLRWLPSWDIYPGELFYSNMMIYLAIVFDVVGMYLPLTGLKLPPRGVQVGIAARIVIIPALIYCPEHDAVRAAVVALMTLSGGYLLSLALEYGVGAVLPDDADNAGYILSFCLSSGLAVGSILNWFALSDVGQFTSAVRV